MEMIPMGFALLLSALMGVVMVMDAWKFTIPNALNVAILLLYPAFVLLHPAPPDWLAGLIGFGVFFALGLVVFATRIIGGGDIKLLMAVAPWLGFGWVMLDFLLLMGVLGGALALLLLLLRYSVVRLTRWPAEKIPEALRPEAPIPYGLAVAGAFLFLLWTGALAGFTMLG